MENYLAEDSSLELQIDASSRESIEKGAWWAKFVGITIIVFVVLLLVGAVVFMNSDALPRLQSVYDTDMLSIIIWAALAVIVLVTGVLMATLLGFAFKSSRAVREIDQDLFESGISSLKTYLIVSGVFTIIATVFALFGLFL